MRGLFVTRKDLVIMSDREKGLNITVKEMLSTATHSYCAQHIAANIQTK
jgi:transposase-like protein